MSFSSRKKSRNYFLFVFVLVTLFLSGERDKRIDSLYTVIKNSGNDSVKINAHLKIAAILMEEDSMGALQQITKANYLLPKLRDKNMELRFYDRAGKICSGNDLDAKALLYWNTGLQKAKVAQSRTWISKFYSRIAMQMQRMDLSKQCIPWFDSALIYAKGGDEKVIADICMLKGRAWYDIGDYKNAMNDYVESQRIYEKNKWENKDYGHLLHFLGSVFKRQKLLDKALEFYQKELDLGIKLKDKGIEGEGLYLCAQIYGLRGDNEKDTEMLLRALEIFKELKNQSMVSLMYGNLANNYLTAEKYDESIKYFELSLAMDLELGKTFSLADTYASLGDLYSKKGEHRKALTYLKKAMDYALKVETKQLLNRASITESMAYAYAQTGDFRSAYDYLLKHRELEDSLNNQSNAEYLHNLQTKYETEKKENEIRLLNAESKMREEDLHKKETQGRMFLVIALLGVVVAGVSIAAFVSKQKTSKILRKQVNEINYQNTVIKEKNKDITDSIQYAKRLQEAVFPEADALNHYFAESFVLFRPRDIVSGDFYWFEQAGDKTIVAVGDCTGHGVPGAFMSILGHNLLNQIILEYGNTNPADILRLLDKQVSSALNKRGNRQEYNDGMDIAICVVDKHNKKLSFAGANRPLIIQRGETLIEMKPNKFAIGGIQDESCKLFMKQEIDLAENDVLYLFSDGYYDQFGGPSGKKFKYKNLAEKIKSIRTNSLKEQKVLLSQAFDEWMGKLEQVDDVCLIGIRI